MSIISHVIIYCIGSDMEGYTVHFKTFCYISFYFSDTSFFNSIQSEELVNQN